MMRVRETGKYLTYSKSTFHVRGSLRYVVLLGWPPFIAFQLSPTQALLGSLRAAPTKASSLRIILLWFTNKKHGPS